MNNNFWNCVERYHIFKWIRQIDKAAEQRRAEKARQKFEKKRIIDMYGYQYYLRDKTWNSIKNQKKRETFVLWRYRLAIYGFTINGYDTKYKQQHYSKPLVHEYRFNDEVDFYKNTENSDMKDIWNKIVESFSKNPRDVLTFGKRKYFYVYAEKDDVYVESGREHRNASKIKVRRKLDSVNLEAIYAAYKSGSKPSETLDMTYNSVYWMGIFRDLDL